MIVVEGNCEGHDYHVEVSVKKITDAELIHAAAQRTAWGKVGETVDLYRWYRSGHSPIRTQEFWVDLIGLPHFVHTHYVRHHVGIQPFVKTGREDRGMKGEQTRWTPGEMSLMVNAQALINMSRQRLCTQAHVVTRFVHEAIRNEVLSCDPNLAHHMVKECVYRGFCPEFRSCYYVDKPEFVTALADYRKPRR